MHKKNYTELQKKYIGEFIDKNENILKLWKECCFKFLKPDSTGNLLFEFGKFYSA